MDKKIILILRVAVAIVFAQTLFFKFTAHPDSVYIFTKVGLDPYGRIGIGIFELISAILILIPSTVWAGTLIALGVISGAILMHLTKLGVEINNDGGTLFFMAIGVFISSLIILRNQRKNIPYFGTKF